MLRVPKPNKYLCVFGDSILDGKFVLVSKPPSALMRFALLSRLSGFGTDTDGSVHSFTKKKRKKTIASENVKKLGDGFSQVFLQEV